MPVMAPITFGERLRRLRRARAMTQEELAKAAGVAPATIVRLERNQTEAQIRTLRRLAAALGVEPRDLIEGIED